MPIPSLPPSKKRKTSVVDDKTSRIQQLEQDLNDAILKNTSLNKLVDLLDIAQTADDPRLRSKSMYALYRVFVSIIASRRLALKGDESAKVVRGWIWERLNAYTDLLVGLMSHQEKSLRVCRLLDKENLLCP
jgi:U3 small nucleolar RNA-associated protein 19